MAVVQSTEAGALSGRAAGEDEKRVGGEIIGWAT